MSLVDVTKPASPIALTSDVRKNFAIIKTELEALQAWRDTGVFGNSPEFTGNTQVVDLTVSGVAAINTLEATFQTAVALQEVTLSPASEVTAIAETGVGPGLTFTKSPLGIVYVSGFLTFTLSGVMAVPRFLLGVGLLNAAFRPIQAQYMIIPGFTNNVLWRMGISPNGSISFFPLSGSGAGNFDLAFNGSYVL